MSYLPYAKPAVNLQLKNCARGSAETWWTSWLAVHGPFGGLPSCVDLLFVEKDDLICRDPNSQCDVSTLIALYVLRLTICPRGHHELVSLPITGPGVHITLDKLCDIIAKRKSPDILRYCPEVCIYLLSFHNGDPLAHYIGSYLGPITCPRLEWYHEVEFVFLPKEGYGWIVKLCYSSLDVLIVEIPVIFPLLVPVMQCQMRVQIQPHKCNPRLRISDLGTHGKFHSHIQILPRKGWKAF